MSKSGPAEIKKALSKNQDVIRARLNDALEERGWDRTVLSKRSGVARPTIYNFLSGTSNIGTSALRSIAEALDVSEQFLLGITAESTRQPAITATSLPKSQSLSDGHSASEDLELSDKIARLKPDHRAIVENMVDAMLAQNNLKTATKPKR